MKMNLKKSICWPVVMVLLLLFVPAQAAEAPEALHPTRNHCFEYDITIRRV
jgi:hypothetical protein